MKTQYHQGHRLDVSELRKLQFIRNNEIGRAIASKLIRDPNKTGVSGYQGKRYVDESVMNRLSKATANNIEDSSHIFQTLPDTKVAMEIWVSCLMSPKDGMTESLVWRVDNSNTEYSAELFGEMLNKVRDYFENEYGLIEIVKPAIENALFKTGSFPIVVIPESSIDDIVNGKSAISSESIVDKFYKKDSEGYKVPNIGLLGDIKKKTSIGHGLESIGPTTILNSTNTEGVTTKQIHNGLTVTDNPDILKFQLALNTQQNKTRRSRLRSHYGMEAYANVNFDEVDGYDHSVAEGHDGKLSSNELKNRYDTKVKDKLSQLLYKERAYTNQPILNLKASRDASRLGVGHPLVLHVPSSAVIPIHSPGNPRDVVGAFIILDEYGNPLDSSEQSDLFDDSRQSAAEKVTGANRIIREMNFFKEGCCSAAGNNDRETLNELAKTYGSLLEEDLLTRLANGLNGDNVRISNVEEIWRMMLARALSAQRTQLLYCPPDLLTYFAFDYNKYGIGKSLIEDGRTLAALRSSLMYADIFSSIQNAIGRRKLNITPSELDPNPMKTMEVIKSEYMRSSAWNMPLMSEGPIDAVNVLREANIDIVINGEHPGIPNTQVELEDVQVSRPQIDTDLNEKIRNMHLASLELPATIVDETQNAQFATQAITANALFNKRILAKQRIIAEQLLYPHVCQYTLNSGNLIRELSLVIKDNKDLLTDKQRANSNTFPIIEAFLDSLVVELPAPDNMRVEDQSNDISRQKGFIDSVVDAVYPDELISMILPEEINDKSSLVKEVLKSSLISSYIDGNGFLPEMGRLLDGDNTDDTISTTINTLLAPLSKLSVDAVLTFDKIRKENEDSALKGALPEESNSFGGSSDDSFGDESDDSSNGEFGGEFSMDDEFGEGGDTNDDNPENDEGNNEPQDDLIGDF